MTAPLEEVVAWVLENARVRPGFAEFVSGARDAGWEVHIVSSGFHELIEPVLEREGVQVPVHANRVDPRPDGWRVQWRYPDDCDVCGESCKRTLLPAGEVVYVGDGYSDRCAALAADRVFATAGLAEYLAERGTPFEHFSDFRALSRALVESSRRLPSWAMALLRMPEPYDFELSTERYRAFGPDLANLWHDDALHRVVDGRELRIGSAEGGVDVEPLDPSTEPVVRKLLGAEFDLDAFYGFATGDPTLAGLVDELRGLRPPIASSPSRASSPRSPHNRSRCERPSRSATG